MGSVRDDVDMLYIFLKLLIKKKLVILFNRLVTLVTFKVVDVCKTSFFVITYIIAVVTSAASLSRSLSLTDKTMPLVMLLSN